MECIYLTELSKNSQIIKITADEARHLRALRIKDNEHILITNGSGLICKASVIREKKDEYVAQIINFLDENYGELSRELALGVGILQDRERFEMILEKSVELGVSHFFPLITDYSQKKSLNSSRLQAKAVSAMKQCKRSRLPKIYEPLSLQEISMFQFEKIILSDENGEKPNLPQLCKSVLLLVGPEGGFSQREIEYLNKLNIEKWKLGNRRLRTETAAISGLSLLSIF
ncbi:MAG: 16S rRNA (uracil(1498)-N(3))-methyltransferase [Ignavibacteria bacterium]|nr:16S rRNA (uracil(1498)-N(3))-methyltransferase [Ignavibacteria bacterium]